MSRKRKGMDKEKEIQEMLQVIAEEHFEQKPHEYIADMPRAICKALHNAGYRKTDEVRKETAKEILQILKDNLHCGKAHLDWLLIWEIENRLINNLIGEISAKLDIEED